MCISKSNNLYTIQVLHGRCLELGWCIIIYMQLLNYFRLNKINSNMCRGLVGYLFSSGEFSQESVGTLPINSYHPYQDQYKAIGPTESNLSKTFWYRQTFRHSTSFISILHESTINLIISVIYEFSYWIDVCPSFLLQSWAGFRLFL